jgi:hypothetical protein
MKPRTSRSVFVLALFAVGFTLLGSTSNAGTFNLDVIATSNFDISNVFVFTSGPEFTSTGPRSVSGGTTSQIFINDPFPDPSMDDDVLVLGVVTSGSHARGLALFTNTSFNGAGQSFSTLFGVDEAALVSDLITNNGAIQNLINFVFSDIYSDGIVPGNPFTITEFSDGKVIGSGTTVTAAVPVPGTLPLFAGGLSASGVLRWCRKRKGQAGT